MSMTWYWKKATITSKREIDMEWLKGKKTYLIVLAFIVVGVLDMTGQVEIANSIYGILTALGLTFSRVGSVKE